MIILMFWWLDDFQHCKKCYETNCSYFSPCYNLPMEVSFMFWMKYRLFNFALHWDSFIQRSLARSLCSINCLALGLGHFVALESFHSLLVFLDEPLEFEYYCLLLETYVSSLCCNRFNSWVTILFVHFLLTCIFLVQNRFQLTLS